MSVTRVMGVCIAVVACMLSACENGGLHQHEVTAGAGGAAGAEVTADAGGPARAGGPAGAHGLDRRVDSGDDSSPVQGASDKTEPVLPIVSADAVLGVRTGTGQVEQIARVEPWTFHGQKGRAYISAHYRILTTMSQTFVADRLILFTEASLARFGSTFASLPDAPAGMEIFILKNRPQWRQFVAESLGKAGINRYDAIERGGFTERGRTVIWDIGVHDTFAILAHEGWHQYNQLTIREPLPTWLDEGIAVWAEGFRWNPGAPGEPEFLPWANIERFDQLRRAQTAGKSMSLEKILTDRPQDLIKVSSSETLTYYAQCWALVHFIVSDPHRKASLDRLLADYAAGTVGSRVRAKYGSRAARAFGRRRAGLEVWKLYFGDDLDTQARAYDAYLHAIVAPGAKNAIVQGRSPVK